MSLASFSSVELRRVIKLVKEKESLQARLDKVILDLNRFEGGRQPDLNTASSSVVRQAVKRRTRRRRGMQAAVLKVLEVAGAKGMTVRDLAAKAKVNPSSLNTWLYTAGKKLSGLKKLSPGVFAYKSSV